MRRAQPGRAHPRAPLTPPRPPPGQVGSTFLQMKFVLDNGREHQEVVTEMSLPQFYQFLAQMERAKAVMDGLST